MIVNRYPGSCATCAARVGPLEGHAVSSGRKPNGRRDWVVYCQSHAPSETTDAIEVDREEDAADTDRQETQEMSAQPARNITDVVRDENDAVTAVLVGDRGTDRAVVAIGDLPWMDLLRAAKLAFPDVNRDAWITAGKPRLLAAMRGEADVPTDAPPKMRPADVPKSNGHVPTDDPAAMLAAAVQAIAAANRGAVDVDTVREIVRAEVDRAQLPQLHAVSLDGAEPKMLPDAAHDRLPLVIRALAAGVHVFMVGPAGSGKSTIAHQAADALETPFYALSLGPTTPTSKMFGYMNATGDYVRTPFREAYENGGVMLLDELDNGHPGLVAEINQALANGYCAFADGMVKRHASFRMVATGNTFGRGPDRQFVGRNILDAATLDRFVTVEIPYDENLERRLAMATATDDSLTAVRDWIATVQLARKRAADLKLPLIFSPRATIEGAKLLTAGVDLATVKEIRLVAGIAADQRAKVGL